VKHESLFELLKPRCTNLKFMNLEANLKSPFLRTQYVKDSLIRLDMQKGLQGLLR